MSLLSQETERELKFEIVEAVEEYLSVRELILPNLTGLISLERLENELDVNYKTIQKWERAGLKRYQPPLEDTRKVYYRITDVLIFFGVENGKS